MHSIDGLNDQYILVIEAIYAVLRTLRKTGSVRNAKKKKIMLQVNSAVKHCTRTQSEIFRDRKQFLRCSCARQAASNTSCMCVCVRRERVSKRERKRDGVMHIYIQRERARKRESERERASDQARERDRERAIARERERERERGERRTWARQAA